MASIALQTILPVATGKTEWHAPVPAGLPRVISAAAIAVGKAGHALCAALLFGLLAAGYGLVLAIVALAGAGLRLHREVLSLHARTSRRWRHATSRDYVRWRRATAQSMGI